jgi:hypothetical protein
MGDEEAKALAQWLKVNSALLNINLCKNNMRDERAKA